MRARDKHRVDTEGETTEGRGEGTGVERGREGGRERARGAERFRRVKSKVVETTSAFLICHFHFKDSVTVQRA